MQWLRVGGLVLGLMLGWTSIVQGATITLNGRFITIPTQGAVVPGDPGGEDGDDQATGLDIGTSLLPFNTNSSDLAGPISWAARYGKTPEIIVSSLGSELAILAQDYDEHTAWTAVLIRVTLVDGQYRVTRVQTDLPMLDRVMGLAMTADGSCYYATGVDEDAVVDSSYPPLDTYRSNIVRVIKVNQQGQVVYNVDLDTARQAFNASAEMIINPMVAATSRLAVGGGEVALVHGINTDPDWNISGRRHQKALSTRLDATTGAITRTSSAWCSHSFDQRLFFDGSAIVEYHLGDAYPRYLLFSRNHGSTPLFHIKGALGENETWTRLGNLALIEGDATYGYLALFASEDTADTSSTINGSRNLAIVRVNRSDYSLDPSLPDSLIVTSSGSSRTNRLRWITSYSAASNLHAERPKLLALGNDHYLVLWEQWLANNNGSSFQGVYGMMIDAQGAVLRGARQLTSEHHLHRGDDAFVVDGKGGWMTGNQANRQLLLHLVDEQLDYTTVTFR